MQWRVLAPIIATCAGCGVLSGLDGLDVIDGAAPDASDAGSEASTIDVAVCDAGACGAPAGFQPLLYASNRSTACPASSATADIISDPSLSVSASCDCTCDQSAQAMCLPASLGYHFNDTCSMGGSLPFAVDGGCNVGSGLAAPARMSIGVFPATCATKTKANGNASTPPGRTCILSACDACAAPPGFTLCYAAPGDVMCPLSMNKHTAATAADVACSACAGCTVTGSCGGALKIFDSAQCSSISSSTINLDGTCQDLTVSTLGSVHYTPSLGQVTCSPGTSKASLQLTSQVTICCP